MPVGDLAIRVNYSRSGIANIEAGRREFTEDLAIACDRILGTAPLLSVLLALDGRQGDTVRRRAFLGAVGALTLTGGNAAPALAEVIRSGVIDGAGNSEDWDSVIADYDRRLVTDPSEHYGRSLLAQLLVAKQVMADRGTTSDSLRAVASLGQLYGLWLGNQGQVSGAHGWYRTARHLADQSADPWTRVYVRGRALSRGIYEGYTVRETVDGVEEALNLTREPTVGAVESYSALVHVHGLTGNLVEGRAAVAGMRDVVDGLPSSETAKVAGPVARTASFANYLECRLGTRAQADQAFDEAEPLLRPVPVWWTDARIYHARAHVVDGDVQAGIEYALDAVRALGPDVRVLRVGVQDLVSVVPRQHRSDELEELRTYAATGPAPWETVI